MANANAKAKAAETVTLVSPDGAQKREVTVGGVDEVKLRFDGYLPAEQQKLPAPEKPAPTAPTSVGTNA